jgi:hypothetical protein
MVTRYAPPTDRGYSIVDSPEIVSRDQFADLCNKHKLCGRAVEVGTDKAAWAVKFLKRWKGNKLVCIDPWRPLDDCREISRDREPDLAIAAAALAPFNWRVEIQRRTSEEVAGQWKVPLSFCYIDANHDYEHVLQDIALWWPHVAPGGILAGHDVGGEYPGVLRAVREFAATGGLRVYLTPDTPQSWYTYKPPVPALEVNRQFLWDRLALADDTRAGYPLLTLIIPRIPSRAQSWKTLCGSLNKQCKALPFHSNVVKILSDETDKPVAVKRQRMLDLVESEYVAFVDDDDEVADAYLSRLVEAISLNPGVDVISFEGWRTEDGKKHQRMHWSMAIEQNHRTPETRYILANHICAMRTELCRQVRFWRPTEYASDQLYWRSLYACKLLQTEVHLPDQLYHYDFRWNVTATQGKERYAAAKALNPHRFYRFVTPANREGQLAYGMSEPKDGVLSVMLANGTEEDVDVGVVEPLGQFDIW